MLRTGTSLYRATIPPIPTILNPSLWLDEGFGVTANAGTVTSWTCRATGKQAVPSPLGFALENGEIKSYYGMGMSFPATQAQTICIIMRHDGYPSEAPNNGKISAVLGDNAVGLNNDYIFLSHNRYEMSLDGRVNREGFYQKNNEDVSYGADVGAGPITLNTTHSLLVRYPTVPAPWQTLGIFEGASSYSSQSTWHQVMLFDRMLNDAETVQLLNWSNGRYSTA